MIVFENHPPCISHQLDLLVPNEHGDAFLLPAVLIVHHHTEVLVDEVMCQQVAAVTRKLIELLVKRHVVLIARDGGMA